MIGKEFLNIREPIIVLEPFKFLNRQYKKGDLFDRRRVRIRNHILNRFMENGVLCFAKTMPENDLAKLGWIYDTSKRVRYPLIKIETPKISIEDGDIVTFEGETELKLKSKQVKFKKNKK